MFFGLFQGPAPKLMPLDHMFSELSLGLLAAGWLKTRFKKSTEEEELEEGASSSPSLRLLPCPSSSSSEVGAKSSGGESHPVDGASVIVLGSSGDGGPGDEHEAEVGASSTLSANIRSKYDTVSVASSSFDSLVPLVPSLKPPSGAAVVSGDAFRSANRCK